MIELFYINVTKKENNKQALHNRLLLPHLFSFQNYGDDEHKPTGKICVSRIHLRYRVPITVFNALFTNSDTNSVALAKRFEVLPKNKIQ